MMSALKCLRTQLENLPPRSNRIIATTGLSLADINFCRKHNVSRMHTAATAVCVLTCEWFLLATIQPTQHY